ncbi:MAG: hypothetical protein RDU20_02230 [Desulfomonilaceae bacterium]|nr:hypothetical protein [Desulfomonilaceae bacterium]
MFRPQERGIEALLLTWFIFLFVGTLSGVIIAYAMDMNSPRELVQGAVGGLIAGLLMSAMLPH